ncbi:hypothetical protein MWU77_00380 [Rhodococcus sp. F64268]|uniref:hypothetical protein n=1 Tax=Rhodococcus sp. F64268 TaxID=2926402 RepID=UPI001FF3ABE2|nr:hypothetical protein [Rhodococcus sp. F64268]MCK0089235.1 hypothetical protein [Rhodococcus sp. F64268]
MESAEILEFAVKWLPFGGGSDEDIFVRFGIGPEEYFSRLIEAINTSSCSKIDAQQVIALAHSRRRLPPEHTLM